MTSCSVASYLIDKSSVLAVKYKFIIAGNGNFNYNWFDFRKLSIFRQRDVCIMHSYVFTQKIKAICLNPQRANNLISDGYLYPITVVIKYYLWFYSKNMVFTVF